MHWFLIALINPLAHAFANHLDKYLISRYMKGGAVGALILFLSLFAVIALPVIFLLDPHVFRISAHAAVFLAANGALLVAAIIFYYYALSSDEASIVTPLFQIMPVLGFGLGYLILGETLGTREIAGSILIIVGGLVLSLDLTQGKWKLKKRLLLFVACSSFFYALNGVIFKNMALDQGFTGSLFWDMFGKFAFGVIIFILVRPYRRQFIEVIKENRLAIIALAFLTEVISTLGEVALVLAAMFAPVALVQAVGGMQPMFVFVLGIIITLFFPRLGRENLEKRMILQKITAIAVMAAGVLIIFKI